MLRIWTKRLLGLLALLIGVTLSCWFVYNQIWPTDEFKAGFRSVFQLIVPIACIVVGWQWLRYEGKGIDQITPPDLNCAELNESVRQARDSMPAFIAEVEKGIDGANIKFPMMTKQGYTEHIWAYVHFYRDGYFNVSLVNTPNNLIESAEGRRDVAADEVEDWQIIQPDGRIRGGYSLIALFRYHEGRGLKLSPLMKKQKSQLLDAA